MQVYRFVTEFRGEEDPLFLESENESRNLTQNGLISPSDIYLQNPVFHGEEGYNTFGKEKEMSKYFFASLAELFVSLRMHYENGFFSKGERFSQSSFYTIMGLDLPLALLKSCMGIGYYNRYDFVEFRIPYQDLMMTLGNKIPFYMNDLFHFYNANLFTEDLHLLDEYKLFERYLSLCMEDIYKYNRHSIYPLFCFRPRKMEIFGLDYEEGYLQDAIVDYDELGRWYICERSRDSSQFKENFEEMMRKIDKENQVLKRELLKK